MGDNGRHVRSALFVDFDNVFLNLGGGRSPAARVFATDPGRWLQWMEDDMGHVIPDAHGDTERRILLRHCYLNPERFGAYRAAFTRHAFRVIDCPSMTGQGKNSADIHMVLDIIDALGHLTVFDEFILLSADADFTPVMTRLRLHDRRTVLLATGPAASALQNACDLSIPTEIFLSEALGADTPTPAPAAVTVADQAGTSDPTVEDLKPQMRRVLNEVVAAAPLPVPLATAAQRVLDEVPEALNTGWGGHSSFRKFVEASVHKHLQICGPHPPGYIHDPARHPREEAGEEYPALPEALHPLAHRVLRPLRAPILTPEVYAAVFTALEVHARTTTANASTATTARHVATDCADHGVSVAVPAVAFILRGLAMVGVDWRTAPVSDLTSAFADNLVRICANRGIAITSDEEDLLRRWLRNDLPPTTT